MSDLGLVRGRIYASLRGIGCILEERGSLRREFWVEFLVSVIFFLLLSFRLGF